MEHQRAWIPMEDGTRLAARLWLPDELPAPALIEALPYRMDHLTSSYAAEYERLCREGGLAVARIDLRGTGSSEGVAEDEYPAQEQEDLVDAIEWLAAQDWCSGRVGIAGELEDEDDRRRENGRNDPQRSEFCGCRASDTRGRAPRARSRFPPPARFSTAGSRDDARAVTSPPTARTPRLREHGVRLGRLEPGPLNAITDVAGVAVGHVTVWRDEPEPPEGRGVARTGITAVVPRSQAALLREAVPAGGAVLNGAGEMTGFIELSEWGTIRTPVYLTSTHAVGRVYDGAVAAAVASNPAVGVDRVIIPVVAECDDSRLSEARVVHVEAADVSRALEAASSGPVPEGAVGAGAGMISFGYKAGIGTASRELPSGGIVGVLVLANFGSRRDLRVDGVPVGRALSKADEDESRVGGSCIAVVAADVPLSGHVLTRVARRAGLGLARVGSVAHHGSGEIFIAFSTEDGAAAVDRDVVDDLFLGVVEATEEAALNALWAAPDVQGRAGRVVTGLPHDEVLELLAEQGRLPDR